MQDAADEIYQAGDLSIDLGLQSVSRHGVPIPLPRLSFDLLVALVKVHPRLLTIEDLMDLVWAPAVVNPETVGQRVKLLRHSLGDDPRHPRYIAGVRGRGYRFDPTVTCARRVAEPRPELQPELQPEPRHEPRLAPSRRPVLFALAAIILIVATVVIDRRWAQTPRAAAPGGGVAPQSVAVMPFLDMSDRRDQGYFADGLTDELIHRLTGIAGLDVASTTSSFYFKGKPVAMHDVAKALRVANFLEGSVRTSGNRLLITAQLVRIDNGYQIWSGAFDRPLTDLFKVQDEITAAVSQGLKLSHVDHYTPRMAPTENIEAYTLYLQGESNITSNGSDQYDAAADELHSALTLDPKFADAWAALAKAILFKGNIHGIPTAQACVEARKAANQALALDPRLEEGHRAAGATIQYCDGNLSAAEAQFTRAIELEPWRADALRSYAWLLVDAGRFDQARLVAQSAVDRDPLSGWNYVALGDAYWRSGQISQAEAAYQRSVELDPTIISLHALYANVLLSAHKPRDAVREAQLEPDPQYRQLTLALALDAAGRENEAQREISRYEALHADDDPGEIAVFYACRNDANHAIEWLQKFSAKHVGEFASLPNRIACFKNIATDPRYFSLQQAARQQITGRPLTAKVRSFRHVDHYLTTGFSP